MLDCVDCLDSEETCVECDDYDECGCVGEGFTHEQKREMCGCDTCPQKTCEHRGTT